MSLAFFRSTLKFPKPGRWLKNGSSLRTISVFDSLPDASSTLASGLTWLPSTNLSLCLHAIEDHTGLPLFISIGLSCISVRLCTVPLLVLQQRQSALLASCRHQLQHVRYLFSIDREMPFSERLATYRKTVRIIKKHSGYSRLKAWPYFLVQTPLFFCFVLSLRQVLSSDPSMTYGGAIWFTDLTSKDSTLVLPAVALGLTYYSLEQALMRRKGSPEKAVSVFSKLISWYVLTDMFQYFESALQVPDSPHFKLSSHYSNSCWRFCFLDSF